jgi:hypothetical protein
MEFTYIGINTAIRMDTRILNPQNTRKKKFPKKKDEISDGEESIVSMKLKKPKIVNNPIPMQIQTRNAVK